MEKVNISQLKKSLSYYLDLARSGTLVVVLDRKRPVAKITSLLSPTEGQQNDLHEERLSRLVGRGIVQAAASNQALSSYKPPVDLNIDVSEMLSSDREEESIEVLG